MDKQKAMEYLYSKIQEDVPLLKGATAQGIKASNEDYMDDIFFSALDNPTLMNKIESTDENDKQAMHDLGGYLHQAIKNSMLAITKKRNAGTDKGVIGGSVVNYDDFAKNSEGNSDSTHSLDVLSSDEGDFGEDGDMADDFNEDHEYRTEGDIDNRDRYGDPTDDIKEKKGGWDTETDDDRDLLSEYEDAKERYEHFSTMCESMEREMEDIDSSAVENALDEKRRLYEVCVKMEDEGKTGTDEYKRARKAYIDADKAYDEAKATYKKEVSQAQPKYAKAKREYQRARRDMEALEKEIQERKLNTASKDIYSDTGEWSDEAVNDLKEKFKGMSSEDREKFFSAFESNRKKVNPKFREAIDKIYKETMKETKTGGIQNKGGGNVDVNTADFAETLKEKFGDKFVNVTFNRDSASKDRYKNKGIQGTVAYLETVHFNGPIASKMLEENPELKEAMIADLIKNASSLTKEVPAKSGHFLVAKVVGPAAISTKGAMISGAQGIEFVEPE